MSTEKPRVTQRKFTTREVQANDPAKSVPGLHLADLRELVATADGDEFPDDALVFVQRLTEATQQPGRYFVGTLVVQRIS